MYTWLYDISADGGKSWTTQWLTEAEAMQEKLNGYIVRRRTHLLKPTYKEAT